MADQVCADVADLRAFLMAVERLDRGVGVGHPRLAEQRCRAIVEMVLRRTASSLNTLRIPSNGGFTGSPRNLTGAKGIRTQDPTESSFETWGDVIDFVPTLAPPGRVIALTLEWGTIGESMIDDLATNARMILENQAHFHGCAEPVTCVQIRRNFADLFNPPDPAFRAAVLDQSNRFLDSLTEKAPRFP